MPSTKGFEFRAINKKGLSLRKEITLRVDLDFV
jgi:hypothetical protein